MERTHIFYVRNTTRALVPGESSAGARVQRYQVLLVIRVSDASYKRLSMRIGPVRISSTAIVKDLVGLHQAIGENGSLRDTITIDTCDTILGLDY